MNELQSIECLKLLINIIIFKDIDNFVLNHLELTTWWCVYAS